MKSRSDPHIAPSSVEGRELAIDGRSSDNGVAEEFSSIGFPYLTEDAACFNREAPESVDGFL